MYASYILLAHILRSSDIETFKLANGPATFAKYRITNVTDYCGKVQGGYLLDYDYDYGL